MDKKNTFFYIYKIRYSDNGKLRKGKGIVCGEIWTNVIDKLVMQYGEMEMFAIDKLIAISDCCCCVEFDEINYILKSEGCRLELIKEGEYPPHDLTPFSEEG